jgi:hypothetical protein
MRIVQPVVLVAILPLLGQLLVAADQVITRRRFKITNRLGDWVVPDGDCRIVF